MTQPRAEAVSWIYFGYQSIATLLPALQLQLGRVYSVLVQSCISHVIP